MFHRKYAAALALLMLLSACQSPTPPAPVSSASAVPVSSAASSVAASSSSVAETSSAAVSSSEPVSSSVPASSSEVVSSVPASSVPAPPPAPVSSAAEPLRVLAERADEVSVLMVAEEETYPADVKQIKLLITNGSEQEISYDTNFVLEKKEDGLWNKVRFRDDAAFMDIAALLAPGKTAKEKIPTDLFFQPLTVGEYRVTKKISGSGTGTFELGAVFTLGAPEGALDLEKPKSIRVSAGDGKHMLDTTLTLKQRYEGRSSVTYVMDLLEGFVPEPADLMPVSGAGGSQILLTLIYPDGLERKLFLMTESITGENGELTPVTALVDGQQRYYSLDAQAFDKIMVCAQEFGGSPRLVE